MRHRRLQLKFGPMSETASGLARVFVLLLATATFTAGWNGDRQVQQQFIVARKANAEHSRRVLLAAQAAESIPTPAVGTPHVAVGSASAVRPRAAAPDTTSGYVARVEVEMLLPRQIAPGRYQVVDQSGRVQTIHITLTEHEAEERDIYVLDQQDGSRRFFIRISDLVENGDLSRTTVNGPSTRR